MTAHPPPLLIRADGGGAVGLGHLMRCLALAQSWRMAGGVAIMVCHRIPPETRVRFADNGVTLVESPFIVGSEDDARNLARVAGGEGAAVVIDGYLFDVAFQRTVSASAPRLMVVDDFGQIGTYHADVILDQNLGVDPEVYRRRPVGCSLLTGSRYVLLRSEFRSRPRSVQRELGSPRRVLVTFGGSDRSGEAAKVVRALTTLDQVALEVKVAVGAGSPAAQILDETARRVDWVEVEHDVADMASLMAWADLAVSAAGSSCWELAFMGVPMVLISTAANQKPIAVSLQASGAAVNLGSHDTVAVADIAREVSRLLGEPQRLRTMRSRAMELVDGLGSRRVVESLLGRGVG